MKYEICYLVGESNESRLAEIREGAEKIVSQEGGVFSGIETLERRKLAYKIGKETRGVYLTRRFELPEREDGAEAEPLRDINQRLNLFPDVLRFLIIKADRLPELKQREIPVRAERGGERRFDRGRGRGPVPFRRAAAPRTELRPVEVKSEAPAEKSAPTQTPEAQAEAIDQKLDEILNI